MINKIRKGILLLASVYTLCILIIAFWNLSSIYISKFVMGYVIVIFLALICIMSTFIFNLKKSKWIKIRKALIKLTIIAPIAWAILVILFYITKKQLILYDTISKAIVIGIAGSFGDMFYLTNEEEEQK